MRKMTKEEHAEHLKKVFGEDYVENNLREGMEKSLRRGLKQLLDMVNDIQSVIYDCIEAEVEVGKSDQIIHSAEQEIIKACKEVGITREEMNEHRYEYFPLKDEELGLAKRQK